jgi:DNA-binding transcriptional LysR family regulator
MQLGNWDHLRYLLAIRRGQTLRAAARQVRVDDTTVSRRIAALEAQLGAKLIERRADNKLALTEVGERVARCAEEMERQYQIISASISDLDGLAGATRVTCVPILANRLFAPAVGTLIENLPNLIIELVADGRNLDLTRREADIAVRLARPTSGGMDIKARRIAKLRYAAYVSSAMRQVRSLPWISYDDSMGHLPHARWMEQATADDRHRRSALRVRDAETALEGVAAGLGKSLLPTAVAGKDRRLRRIEPETTRPVPSRELWLLVHADQYRLPRIAAVIAWLEKVVQESERH